MQQIFNYLVVLYILGFSLIYFLEKTPENAKSVLAISGIIKLFGSPIGVFNRGLPQPEKVAILTMLVKIYFIPLMVPWLFEHIISVLNAISYMVQHKNEFVNFTALFEQYLYFFCFNTILIVDVLFFTLGYLVEYKALDNKILSVEPTLFGWMVALACYPPFNDMVNSTLLTAETKEFAAFSNLFLMYFCNIVILILMAMYAWASASLGLKASNLTHRGIVSHGPYAYIRHPAYVCKNLAWWIGSIPIFIAAAHSSLLDLLFAILGMAGWSTIYFYRALTEERHLLLVNEEYQHYKSKVPAQFIPKLTNRSKSKKFG